MSSIKTNNRFKLGNIIFVKYPTIKDKVINVVVYMATVLLPINFPILISSGKFDAVPAIKKLLLHQELLH
ncbi:hypothetical protein CFSAN002369_12479 [Clostridium botulinum CFSAN002369]|nr:hypothetical protein CFSAN002369_12479 [Clostridium botulinum CFSAN002369]